eukprot:1981469-Rhodomonas_salina.2
MLASTRRCSCVPARTPHTKSKSSESKPMPAQGVPASQGSRGTCELGYLCGCPRYLESRVERYLRARAPNLRVEGYLRAGAWPLLPPCALPLLTHPCFSASMSQHLLSSS